MVAVTDTGTGMSEEVRAKVFEPFFTTKGPGKGSGLGLSQVHGFVRQAGGTAAVESAPGRGTTVRLFLPRAAGGAQITPAAELPAIDDAPISAAVLLVDDDREVREFTATCLRQFGCSVRECSTGRAALEVLLTDEPFDLLLVDFAMPGQNGAEVARLARQQRPGLNVLCMTGYADTVALDEVFRPDELIKKPYKVADLATRVRAVLGSGRRRPSHVIPLRPRQPGDPS
jgi:CheY-like chemotaxis protein